MLSIFLVDVKKLIERRVSNPAASVDRRRKADFI